MKYRVQWINCQELVLLVFIIFILVGCGGGTEDSEDVNSQKSTGNISGFSTDSSTGAVVPNVLVKISGKEVNSAGDGAYEIKDISEGNNTITASKTGYQAYSVNISVTKEQTLSHDIVLNPVVETQSPTTDGLIAYYSFDGDANDSSGNENHGTAFNVTLISDRKGNNNSAYEFNGVDSYIDTGIERSSYSDISICAWYQYYGTIDDGYRSLFGGNGTNFAIAKDRFNSNIGIQDSNYIPSFAANTNAWNGDWHHLCYSNASGVGKVYLDNILVGSSSIGQGNGNIWIGRENQAGVFPLDGILDEIRIYSKVLSEAEIGIIFKE